MSTICLHCLLRSACAWHSRANKRVRSKSWAGTPAAGGRTRKACAQNLSGTYCTSSWSARREARRHQGADTKSARVACTHQSSEQSAILRIWHRDSLVVIVRCALLYYRLFLGDQIYVVVVECFCFSLSKKHALFWRFFFFFFPRFSFFVWECSPRSLLVWGSRLEGGWKLWKLFVLRDWMFRGGYDVIVL